MDGREYRISIFKELSHCKLHRNAVSASLSSLHIGNGSKLGPGLRQLPRVYFREEWLEQVRLKIDAETVRGLLAVICALV
jgi:hypothetical protein